MFSKVSPYVNVYLLYKMYYCTLSVYVVQWLNQLYLFTVIHIFMYKLQYGMHRELIEALFGGCTFKETNVLQLMISELIPRLQITKHPLSGQYEKVKLLLRDLKINSTWSSWHLVFNCMVLEIIHWTPGKSWQILGRPIQPNHCVVLWI